STDDRVLAHLLALNPLPVGVSPAGDRWLIKHKSADGFELEIREVASGRIIARHLSSETQLGLSWRPDGRAIAFFSRDRGSSLFGLQILEIESGRTIALDVPPAASASFPIAWSPRSDRLAYFGGGSNTLIVVDAP